MDLLCVRCSKKVALRFSKTVLDSFVSFLPLRHEYRELDTEGRTSTDADWIRPSVDSRPESGNAAGRAQQGRMQAHLHRQTQWRPARTSGAKRGTVPFARSRYAGGVEVGSPRAQ